MGIKSSPGGSSPLSSVPDSEGLSLPSLSQVQGAETAAPISEDVETAEPPLEDVVMPSSRPKRTRAAPPPKTETPKKVAKRTPKKKKKWDAENILTDPKSPLATADLRSLLSNPVAWDVLSPTDREEILSLLPSQTPLIPSAATADHPDASAARRPDIAALRNDDTFRHDCTTYTENLAEGRFEREWLECAWTAHERRKMGDFDGFLVRKFEETWETVLPEEMRPKRTRRDVGEDEEGSGLEKKNGEAEKQTKGAGIDEAEKETKGTRNEHGDGEGDHDMKTEEARPVENEATRAATSPPEQSERPVDYKQEQQSPEDKPLLATSNTDTKHKEEEAKITTVEAQNNSDRMVIDELQVEDSPQKKTKQQAHLAQRSNNRMEIDGEDSEDELA